MDTGGRWVRVTFADGRTRQDWVPAAQPPSPDGVRGTWHVVNDGLDAAPRWEWHAARDEAGPQDGGAGQQRGRRRHSITAAGVAMIVAAVTGLLVTSGRATGPAELVASTPLEAAAEATAGTAEPDAAAEPAESDDTESDDTVLRRPRPTTWQQEILAAATGEPIRLTPKASDWAAESIVIGQDIAGKFLGRVTVRYTGPGTAQGAFAVALVKDGTGITTLTGDLVEVRAGVYQVMLSSGATWVEGPWITQFRVVATA